MATDNTNGGSQVNLSAVSDSEAHTEGVSTSVIVKNTEAIIKSVQLSGCSISREPQIISFS